MMSAVARINRRLLERTLLSGAQAQFVAVLYAPIMMLMGLSFALIWRYLVTHDELVAEPARAAFPAGARRAVLGALVYVPAILLAFISPAASFSIDALIAIYFAASKSEVPGLVHRAALQNKA